MNSTTGTYPYSPKPSHAGKWRSSTLRAFAMWAVTCLLGVMGIGPVHAQLPNGCSRADEERNAHYLQSAVQELVQGNLERYANLMRQMESGLSQRCRSALDHQQPTRVRCTAQERNLFIEAFGRMFAFALNGEFEDFVVLYEEMGESVSAACWQAVHYPNEPTILTACSTAELDLSAAYILPMLRATQRSLVIGDYSELMHLGQDLLGRRSPDCNSAISASQQRAERATPGSQIRPSIPNAHDHGGGTFSVSGIGACTPSGCTAF